MRVSTLFILLILHSALWASAEWWGLRDRSSLIKYISAAPRTTAAGQVPPSLTLHITVEQRVPFALVLCFDRDLRPELLGTRPTENWGPFQPFVFGSPLRNGPGIYSRVVDPGPVGVASAGGADAPRTGLDRFLEDISQLVTQNSELSGAGDVAKIIVDIVGKAGGSVRADSLSLTPGSSTPGTIPGTMAGTSPIVNPPLPLRCTLWSVTLSPWVYVAFAIGIDNEFGYNCWLEPGLRYEVVILEDALAPNPEYPQVLVLSSVAFSLVPYGIFSLRGIEVMLPWLTTDPELELSHLQFLEAVPDTTIGGQPLSSLKVTFIPGIQLLAGAVVALEATDGIFRDLTGSSTVFASIGYGDCAALPTSPYCCTLSRAATVRSLGVWSFASFTLGPQGCLLPADKTVTFFVPAALLASNPRVPTGRVLANAALDAVYLRILTSAEPTPILVQRYSYPSLSFAEPLISDPFLTSYVVGVSTITDFSAVPDTLVADVVPSFLTVSMTLNKGLAFSQACPVGPNDWMVPPVIVITANQGVFKPNQGQEFTYLLALTVALPLDADSPSLPAQCHASYVITAYSTVVLKVNPFFSPACAAVLVAGAKLTVQFPSDVLLPNLAAGTTVKFDVHISPPMRFVLITDPSLVDSAALMDIFGYTTVIGCPQMPAAGFFGGVCSIAQLTNAERCLMVAAMSPISPITAGIVQCPARDRALVTFMKYPEGTWTQQHWPRTNIASQGNWAHVVSPAGAAPLAIWTLGHMFSVPMYAVIVVYPPVAVSLVHLGVGTVPSTCQIVFIVRLDRFTYGCSLANVNNPWTFVVSTALTLWQVFAYSACGATATPINQYAYSSWAQGNGKVFVTYSQGGAVVGCAGTTVSPVPKEDESDDALFGLLALIAVPLLLCCCLAALLWFLLRPKRCPCPSTGGVQECYMEPVVTDCGCMQTSQVQFVAPTPAAQVYIQ